MGKELILAMSTSVDGFLADPSGNSDWMFPTMSDEGRRAVAERMEQVSLIAMGRKSYEAWINFWPASTMPMAPAMNLTPKVVFSRSGKITPPAITEDTKAKAEQAALDSWLNPAVAGIDLIEDMKKLKAEEGKPILAIGGALFASSLAASGLVDAFRIVVHPIAIGRGIPLFGELDSHLRLKLEDLRQFETGTIAKTYRPI